MNMHIINLCEVSEGIVIIRCKGMKKFLNNKILNYLFEKSEYNTY